ncbi:hypothetical protein DPMN_099718 [Dreissena polymorpha]|uniref:Uncharacterized protein n=1 Tax=Dreissena polymorpha TaxID=45954 RepID=A0A9D4LG54_DREPO|nr:hypothetical protein DPMN_099718 [Dreissena polymorpha]
MFDLCTDMTLCISGVMKEVFPEPPLEASRRDCNLQDILVHKEHNGGSGNTSFKTPAMNNFISVHKSNISCTIQMYMSIDIALL